MTDSLRPAFLVGRRARRGARRMTVRLLGLNCSPRDNSNSSIMLETAFEKLDATYPGECEHERDQPARPARRAVQGLQRVRQEEGRHLHPLRPRGRGRRPGRPRRHGRRRRHRGGHARLLRPAVRPLQQVHHAHAPAAPPGLQAGQQARRRAGHRRPPLRRRRDGHHRHLAALRAQRLPRRRQRRRHLPVRRLRLGRRPRPHPQRRVGAGAVLPDRAARVHARRPAQGRRRGHRLS